MGTWSRGLGGLDFPSILNFEGYNAEAPGFCRPPHRRITVKHRQFDANPLLRLLL
jgi:hypothetical protein